MIEGTFQIYVVDELEPNEDVVQVMEGEQFARIVRKVNLRIVQSNFGFDANLDPIDAYALGQALINTACIAKPELREGFEK